MCEHGGVHQATPFLAFSLCFPFPFSPPYASDLLLSAFPSLLPFSVLSNAYTKAKVLGLSNKLNQSDSVDLLRVRYSGCGPTPLAGFRFCVCGGFVCLFVCCGFGVCVCVCVLSTTMVFFCCAFL
ncbi:hypothetical protein T440DRAFT_138268 [Plenodomus tracheiphilus IPT5]|uniref:Uncharacterized protein n=1 Tax=Plenodomus tracheiphilus IPT5 TaxID=1408161 RepID=A0A6A7B0U7_9PLEO|nr:hypothetical protein T440DRAFT_138268 [Plenodomus tracheiphilus IPT5]